MEDLKVESQISNSKNLELAPEDQIKYFSQKEFCLRILEMIRLLIHHLLLKTIFMMECSVCLTVVLFQEMLISLPRLSEGLLRFNTTRRV